MRSSASSRSTSTSRSSGCPRARTVAPRYALGVQRALQRAALHVQSAGRHEINGGNVLVAIFHETESHAVLFLQEDGVTRFDVINFISHGVSKIGADEDRDAGGTDEDADDDDAEEARAAGRRRRRSQNVAGQSAENLRDQSDRARGEGKNRSAGRTQERTRARDSRAAAPAQEQSRLRGRGGRRQDRARRRPGAGGPSRRGAATRSRAWRFTRSTWARCWRAPGFAAISSSASRP